MNKLSKNNNISKNGINNTKMINVDLPLNILTEKGIKIIYCPALDISGYGKTEEEAFDSFLLVMSEHITYTSMYNSKLSSKNP